MTEEFSSVQEMEETNDEALPNETKAARFKRVASRRLRAAMKQMQLLENCASTASYEYTPEQIETMINHLTESINRIRTAYAPEAETVSIEL